MLVMWPGGLGQHMDGALVHGLQVCAADRRGLRSAVIYVNMVWEDGPQQALHRMSPAT